MSFHTIINMDIRQIETYFMIFLFYSVLGWIMESVGSIFNKKVGKFVNRGFLIGPYCPVYGFGVLLITLLLQKYAEDFLVLFIMSFVLCGFLEYFTSFIMEKIFHARWWDYSSKKYNINGRICLETLLPFGIIGSIILKYINPIYLNLIDKIPNNALHWISGILFAIILIDTIVSFFIISNLKKVSNTVENAPKDNTEEISKKVRETTEEFTQKLVNEAEDMAMEFTSQVYHMSRKMNIGTKKFTRSLKNSRKKISNILLVSPHEISENVKRNNIIYKKMLENKFIIDQKVKDSKENIYKKLEERKIDLSNTIKNITITQEEIEKKIKNIFFKKSIFHKRLTQAFPTLKINLEEIKIKRKNKNNKNK